MKDTKCYHCEHEWDRKVISPKVCPVCGRDWRAPSLLARLSEAWEAFKMRPKSTPNHRDKVAF